MVVPETIRLPETTTSVKLAALDVPEPITGGSAQVYPRSNLESSAIAAELTLSCGSVLP